MLWSKLCSTKLHLLTLCPSQFLRPTNLLYFAILNSHNAHQWPPPGFLSMSLAGLLTINSYGTQIPSLQTNLIMDVGTMKLHQTFQFSFFSWLSLFALLASAPAAAQLSPGFYSFSCPNVELLVRGTVRSASSMDSTIPAKLLRLLFHDCLVKVDCRIN